jgi:hypothetical protein
VPARGSSAVRRNGSNGMTLMAATTRSACCGICGANSVAWFPPRPPHLPGTCPGNLSQPAGGRCGGRRSREPRRGDAPLAAGRSRAPQSTRCRAPARTLLRASHAWCRSHRRARSRPACPHHYRALPAQRRPASSPTALPALPPSAAPPSARKPPVGPWSLHSRPNRSWPGQIRVLVGVWRRVRATDGGLALAMPSSQVQSVLDASGPSPRCPPARAPAPTMTTAGPVATPTTRPSALSATGWWASCTAAWPTTASTARPPPGPTAPAPKSPRQLDILQPWDV